MYSMVVLVALTGGVDTPAFGFGKGCNGCNGGCWGSSSYGCNGCNGGGFLGMKDKGCNGCNGGGFLGGFLGKKSNGCNGCSGCYGGSCNGCNGGGFLGLRDKGCNGCNGGGFLGGFLGKKDKGCNGCYGGSCHGGSCHGGSCYGSCHGGSCYGSCHGGSCYGHGNGHGCVGVEVHGSVMPHGTIIEEKKLEKMPTEEKKEEEKKEEKKEDTLAPATIVVNIPADAKLYVDDYATKSVAARRVLRSPALPAGQVFTYTLKAELDREGKVETRTERIAVEAGKQAEITFEFAPEAVASK